MDRLTSLLLADAVEKGGPGSGPHPGAHRDSEKARAATQGTRTVEDHKAAAALHTKAAQSFRALASKSPKGSGAARLAIANAKYHDSHAAFHSAAAQGKAVPMSGTSDIH